MKNLAGMMKQAQQMQKNMKELQARMDVTEIEGQSGNGMVQVVMTGKNEVKSIKIDPSIVDADDVETLEDLVLVAINETSKKVQETIQTEMNKITGGLNIPGM